MAAITKRDRETWQRDVARTLDKQRREELAAKERRARKVARERLTEVRAGCALRRQQVTEAAEREREALRKRTLAARQRAQGACGAAKESVLQSEGADALAAKREREAYAKEQAYLAKLGKGDRARAKETKARSGGSPSAEQRRREQEDLALSGLPEEVLEAYGKRRAYFRSLQEARPRAHLVELVTEWAESDDGKDQLLEQMTANADRQQRAFEREQKAATKRARQPSDVPF